MSPHYDISLIIPAYNEALRIRRALEGIEAFARTSGLSCEGIIVLDGCTDNTESVLRNFVSEAEAAHFRIASYPENRGKGAAVQHGVELAAGEVVGFTDAELPYPLDLLPEIVAQLRAPGGPDMVIGARDLPESRLEVRLGIARCITGNVYAWLVQTFLNTGTSDTQCGFKFFRREIAKRIFSRVTVMRFGFDVEVIHIAKVNGLSIARVPVRLQHVAGSSVHVVRDSIRMFWEMVLIRSRDARRYYKFDADSLTLKEADSESASSGERQQR